MVKQILMSIIAALTSLAFSALAQPSNTLLVQFLGPSELAPSYLVTLEAMGINSTGFTCFEMPMIDTKSQLKAGTGVDCLKDVSTLPNPTGVDAVTFFNFHGGTLVNRGNTSIVPFLPGFGDGGTPARTHITGSIPTGVNSIVDGTRQFMNASGTVRLSGAVALIGTANSLPFFDCMWRIDLD